VTILLHQAIGPLFGDGNLVKACREEIYKVCPGLAESWEPNSDFTQWTFKIRDNVLWHDGKPYTAEDAKFWVDLAYNGAKSAGKTRVPAFFRATFGDLKNVEVLPGNRLRLTLGTPNRLYLEGFINPRIKGGGYPSHLMQPLIDQGQVDVAPLDIKAVGVGPFKYLDYQKGSRLRVQRFDGYWEKDKDGNRMPYLDSIDYALIRDGSAMDAAFRTSQLDSGSHGAGSDFLGRARQAGYKRDLGDKINFVLINSGRCFGPGFNMLKPGPWQDVRVRQAASLWFDRKGFGDAVYDGFAYTCTLLAPTNPFTIPDFATWPGWNEKTREADRAEAKRLMAAAGYPNGGFSMGILTRGLWTRQGEYIIAQFAGLGIDVKLQITDEAGWARGRLSKDYDLDMISHTGAPYPEPTEYSFGVYSFSNAAIPKHEDPKVKQLYSQLVAAATPEQRVTLWRQLENYLVREQAYFVPGTGDIVVVPFRSYVKGFVVPGEGPHNNTDYAPVWLEK
jgi:peptide/nickel transport system substrate-binding protein